MKKIDGLILKSFIGPYILSFFIAEFVLVMQLMWKHIDDFLGKGFSMIDILELLLYYGLTIVPMALPISILISSVLVFGDLAEKYELTSLKSAGVGLIRIMAAGIFLAVFTFCLSIFTSNYTKPVALLQFNKRFEVIRRQKPSLLIEEDIFNDDFNSFVIRTSKKYPNNKDMKDVIMYDQSKPDRSMLNLIKADSAQMYTAPGDKYFVMNLYDGYIYQEEDRKGKENGGLSYPFVITKFKKYSKVLDMSEFKFSEGLFDVSGRKEDMLNSFQIWEAIDSLQSQRKIITRSLGYDFAGITKKQVELEALDVSIRNEELRKKQEQVLRDSLQSKKKKSVVPDSVLIQARTVFSESFGSATIVGIKQKDLSDLTVYKSFIETVDSANLFSIFYRAVSAASGRVDMATNVLNSYQENNRGMQKYLLRFNQQYNYAFICIIFLFIGAPLGSIIRKGGYGYPLLVAILFYMVFIISSIMGEKLVRNESYTGIMGAWIPCIIQSPFAIYFTYKALNDSKFEGFQRLVSRLKILTERFGKKKARIDPKP